MTLYQLLAKLNYYSGKDKRGKTFKITEFNDLLPTVQDKLFNDELKKVTLSKDGVLAVNMVAISPLRVFVSSTIVNMTSGIGLLPDDYKRFINVTAEYREVKIISQSEFNDIRSSPFRRTDVNPVCYFTPYGFVMSPVTIAVTELNYFHTPATPYYDYCQDSATLNEIYMPVGSSVYLNDDNVACLYDSTGTLLATGVEKDGTYPIASQTVELEWEDIHMDMFVLAMLSAVGINLDKTELTQYAEGLKQ